MANQQKTEKHKIEVSGGYASKRDQINHRIATLSVFGPIVAAVGGAVFLIGLFSDGAGFGVLIALVGGGMIVYARLLREVIRRWP